MKFVISLLFIVLCKPGIIYEYDGTITEMTGDSKYTYYYYDLDYPDGTYLYVSILKDSVWFVVEDKEFFYLNNNNSMFNEEFEKQ